MLVQVALDNFPAKMADQVEDQGRNQQLPEDGDAAGKKIVDVDRDAGNKNFGRSFDCV